MPANLDAKRESMFPELISHGSGAIVGEKAS